jgi:hypothetical protein
VHTWGLSAATLGAPRTRPGRSGQPAVDVFVADLSAQAEVRRLAEQILQTLSRIDAAKVII